MIQNRHQTKQNKLIQRLNMLRTQQTQNRYSKLIILMNQSRRLTAAIVLSTSDRCEFLVRLKYLEMGGAQQDPTLHRKSCAASDKCEEQTGTPAIHKVVDLDRKTKKSLKTTKRFRSTLNLLAFNLHPTRYLSILYFMRHGIFSAEACKKQTQNNF